MRKLSVTLSTLLLAFPISPLTAANWYEVRRDGRSITYMDPDSIRKTSEGVMTWTKVTYSNKGEFGESYDLLQERWDCAKETRALMNAVLYSADGTVMNSLNYSKDFSVEPIIPGSVVEPQFRYLCQQ